MEGAVLNLVDLASAPLHWLFICALGYIPPNKLMGISKVSPEFCETHTEKGAGGTLVYSPLGRIHVANWDLQLASEVGTAL